ncbi:hypothetical protein TBLA_0A01650 [Henningerozyma blattae CBS 6284]|uniref:Gluconokinase n=1 Tax=Henningerozyma blattae (strain ATCC 34711 / CBS 6284 / DSM 70876 / NBRC 10599 / NRRL Y-10934 / UCD 77-7) TaxID=1071380 RepID=I2GV13_HENB6|nr:hypothetical protein TBLA_0A01650 [Tetrapisispora blattae CBS 6284]CCH57965.1 hypothetical protein TBLA_0A01650 [Tetrapisispora blattae CBS 6284]
MSSEKKYKVIIVGGPSATGKSTVAQNLVSNFAKYDHVHLEYLEGDALHSQENIDKMAKGIPLEDKDRWGWLKKIAIKSIDVAEMDKDVEKCAVVTCSSLKKNIENILEKIGKKADFLFIILNASRADLMERMKYREGHFMKANMVDSQLRDLELPTAEEVKEGVVVEEIGGKSVEQVDADVLAIAENFFGFDK